MVPYPILRHYVSPVCHICIVSECKNSSAGDFRWQQVLRPRRSCILCRPCLLAALSKAVNEDNAGILRQAVSKRAFPERSDQGTSLSQPREHLSRLATREVNLLDHAILYAIEKSNTGREDVSR